MGHDAARFIGEVDSYEDMPYLESRGLRIVMGDAPDERNSLTFLQPPHVSSSCSRPLSGLLRNYVNMAMGGGRGVTSRWQGD